jgi:hypothetical protein
MSIVNAFFGLNKIPRVMKFFEFKSFDDVNRMAGIITQIRNQVQKEGLQLTKNQQKFLDDQMEQVKIVFEKIQNKPDPNRLDTVIDKMDKGVPLNPSDQYDTSGGVLDAFQGFKPKVIQGGKSEKELLEKLNKQNKEAIERIKKRKEKESDPDKKADGGRIGFSGGGAGFAGNQVEQSQPGGQTDMPRNLGFQPLVSMPQFNIPASGGVSELKQFLQATGAPELGMGYNFPVGKSGVLGLKAAPSGNVGIQFKVPLSGGMFGLGKKDGGRIGFKKGTPKNPGRRNFLKLMGGLASLPLIGPLFKGAKTVEKAATAVETVPPYFFQLVNKIRQFGTDITSPGVTTQSRQRVTQYEIDGDDYVMTENLSTGKIEIEKEKIGGMQFYDEYGEMDVADGIMSKEYMTYKPKEFDVDPKTGKKIEYPEEYEEITARPSGDDGTDFETAFGLNDDTVKQIVKETGDLKGVKKYYPDVELTPREQLDKKIQEIIKQRNQKADGGVAYMLGE